MGEAKRRQGGEGLFVRSRTAEDPNKALAQYEELRRGGVKRAVVIAEMPDGSLTVLGQEMRAEDAVAMIADAGQATLKALKHRDRTGRQAGTVETAPEAEPEPQPEGYAGEPGGVMNTAWRSFAEKLLADAPVIQRQEMRRAFYAGGQSLLGGMMGFLDPSTPDETPGDLASMDRLQAELEAFARAVADRRA